MSNLQKILIVESVEVASYAREIGIEHLMVDLEIIGKRERQGHLDTVISDSSPELITSIRKAAPDSRIMVRVNPLNRESQAEIDEVIIRGATSIMIPMFKSADELKMFYEFVNKRVPIIPLIETKCALTDIAKIALDIKPSRVHFGLNDLAINMQHNWMFTPLANKSLDYACQILRQNKIPFGIGGIARTNEGLIRPLLILAKHVSLGSDTVILSRSFHRRALAVKELKRNNFQKELGKLDLLYKQITEKTPKELHKLVLEFEAQSEKLEKILGGEKM